MNNTAAIIQQVVNSTAANNTSCYYSQIAQCSSIPAFQTAGSVVSVFCWITVMLGILASVLSYRSRPSQSSSSLTPFESFLVSFTGCAFFVAIGVTWSSTAGMHTLLLHSFHSAGDLCAFYAVYVLLNMCLKTSEASSPFIKTLRVWVLPFLFVPAGILLVLYLLQGYYSDMVQFQPNGQDYLNTFTLIANLTGMVYILTLTCLIIFLLIARHSFKNALENVRRLHGSKGSETGSSSNSNTASFRQSYATPTSAGAKSTNGKSGGGDSQNVRNLKRALKNAIKIMSSVALGCAYIAAYLAMYLYAGFTHQNTMPAVFILTLIGIYAVLPCIGFVAFIINIISVMRKQAASDNDERV